MFYRNIPLLPAKAAGRAPAAALAVLTSSESKRLIAKAVAALPEVRNALRSGYVVIGLGTTNAFVAEEITGTKIDPKVRYAAGIIYEGKREPSPPRQRMQPFVLHRGRPVELAPAKAVEEFGPDDVYFKGANAVDSMGTAGVLMGNPQGGIAITMQITAARGSHLIMPIGLEKLVPSVDEVAPHLAVHRYKYSTGPNTALLPLRNADVLTEIQAVKVLTGATAFHVASGGIGGSEGSVVLVIEGDDAAVEQAWAIIKGIKGEPPVAGPA